MVAPVVLITGCSEGGIGYHMCEEFAKQGCKVYAGVRRPSAAEGLKPLGVEILTLEVTDEKSREAAILAVMKQDGRLDILVNNAGIAGQTSSLADMTLDSMHLVLDTNLIAPLAIAKLVIPHMARRKKGLIVNISSVAAHTYAPFVTVYGASKAGLTTASNGLRLEVERLGIHVMHVALGDVKTSIQTKVVSSLENDWPQDSMYLRVQSRVLKTIGAFHKTSESIEPSAKAIVSAALKKNPPRQLWTGGKSTLVWLSMFWPLWFTDWVLKLALQMSSWELTPPPPLQQ